jgi:aminopeptidase-like protein
VYAAPEGSGTAMHALIEDLFPICRSITGEGFRESLQRLAQVIPISLSSVPTGTAVFDWTVPKEWNIRDAWIADSSGRRVVDFKSSNLHVVSYSIPVRARMSLAELRPRFDWSALRVYGLNARGENHGILLGTRGWMPSYRHHQGPSDVDPR